MSKYAKRKKLVYRAPRHTGAALLCEKDEAGDGAVYAVSAGQSENNADGQAADGDAYAVGAGQSENNADGQVGDGDAYAVGAGKRGALSAEALSAGPGPKASAPRLAYVWRAERDDKAAPRPTSGGAGPSMQPFAGHASQAGELPPTPYRGRLRVRRLPTVPSPALLARARRAPGHNGAATVLRRVLAGALALCAVGMFALWPRQARGDAIPAVGVAEAAPPYAPFASAEIKAAYAQNGATVGWLAVPGTGIDGPVLQWADNDYFLTRNEAGEADVWGCYFLDCLNHPQSRGTMDRVSIVYGHALLDDPDSLRFSTLKRFRDEEFCRENRTFTLTLLRERLSCRIFAAGEVPVTLNYLDPSPDDAAFTALVRALKSTGEYDFAVGVEPGDKIVILSTCTADDEVRYVVAGVIE